MPVSERGKPYIHVVITKDLRKEEYLQLS